MIDPWNDELGFCTCCGEEMEIWDVCCEEDSFEPYEPDDEPMRFWEDE